MYYHLEYAQGRLTNTIVRLLNGQPIYVDEVYGNDGDILVSFRYLKDGSSDDATIEDLDLKSPPLGFLNINKDALYLTRVPLRRDWRQGIRPENVRLTDIHNSPLSASHAWVSFYSLYKTIVGDYPTIPEAIDLLHDGMRAVAFSRHFCVAKNEDNNLEVFYKSLGKPVAKINEQGDVVELYKDYLKESLAECLERKDV